jgi:hypothetical protein
MCPMKTIFSYRFPGLVEGRTRDDSSSNLVHSSQWEQRRIFLTSPAAKTRLPTQKPMKGVVLWERVAEQN